MIASGSFILTVCNNSFVIFFIPEFNSAIKQLSIKKSISLFSAAVKSFFPNSSSSVIDEIQTSCHLNTQQLFVNHSADK